MKHVLLVLVAVCCGSSVSAQFIPNNGQAYQFMQVYNPAFSGIDSYQDVKLGYRYQWSGFGSDAPKFINLAYSVRLKQPLDLTLNSPRSSQTNGLQPEKYPKGKTSIHGLGLNFFSEQFGPLKRTGGGLNYSYHIAFTKKLRMAMGISGIVESQKIGLGNIVLDDRDNDSYYGELLKNGYSQTTLSARAGILFYTPSFYAGFSYLPLYSTVIQSVNTTDAEEFFMGSSQIGVSFRISPDLVLKPSVMALLRTNGDIQIDYNVKGYIQQKVMAGLSFRDTKSLIVMGGFDISHFLTASYSYEMSLGEFKQFNGSTHELILAFRINNFKGLKPYTW